MKFPYISLNVVLAEAAGELKRMNRQGLFNNDDAYNYAIEAVRLIGGNNYDDDTVAVHIDNHVGILPKNFYTCNEIFFANLLVHDVVGIEAMFNYDGRRWAVGKTLYPGDSSTVNHMSSKGHNPKVGGPGEYDTYIFKIPPGLIRTSFRTGDVGIKYNRLPEVDGIIAVQDEPNCTKAVKCYIKLMLMEESFYAGEIPKYVYDSIKDDYLIYMDQAQAIQKFMDPSHMKAVGEQIDNRYEGFKLR